MPEKVGLMSDESPGVPRLGIPAYHWWNECLHGVARAGTATVFPQAIGLAATFNPPLIREVAEAIAVEARAKHHESVRRGRHGFYEGLTFWSPNINIFRDPRWGRGHETYGECPWLTAEFGVAFVRGLQGDHPYFLKAAACAKHFAVHSGPEGERHGFDAAVSPRDLHETYLPAFRRLVVEARVEAVMGAYNRVNGEPACAHPELMRILREDWGFEGHFVSDCGGIRDFHENHRITGSAAESAALAVRRGCDLNCGCTYPHLIEAIRDGLLEEHDIDRCVRRLMTTLHKLGMFDSAEDVPLADTPHTANDTPAHHALSRRAATESIVLLKNNGVLPLASVKIDRLAVIGPHADATAALLANYHGTPSRIVSPLQGLREAFEPHAAVEYSPGCNYVATQARSVVDVHAAEVAAIAERADVAILVLGLHAGLEGEQGDANNADASGDRRDIRLPAPQLETLEHVLDTGTPTIVVLIHGGPITLGGLEPRCAAIVDAFYPGPFAGPAIADVLTGRYNPAGRLPVTYPDSVEHLPAFEDYAMAGRTYRFADPQRPPLYPFGFGLSYSTFDHEIASVTSTAEAVEVTARVTNRGPVDGDEVVQLYVRDPDDPHLHHELRGVQRIHLRNQETRSVRFVVPRNQLDRFDDGGNRHPSNATLLVWVGGNQPSPLRDAPDRGRWAELVVDRPSG
ncbi:MAG: glycoside hydrolase family 3 C-terminal domain-containing protein [Planctomycetota bacterium]